MQTSPLQKILRLIELQDRKTEIEGDIDRLTQEIKEQLERQEAPPALSVVRGQIPRRV